MSKISASPMYNAIVPFISNSNPNRMLLGTALTNFNIVLLTHGCHENMTSLASRNSMPHILMEALDGADLQTIFQTNKFFCKEQLNGRVTFEGRTKVLFRVN